MQLTDDQKKAVAQWVKEGCGLSEIQKRLGQQFQLAMTYIDVRFLLIDLGLDLKEQAAPADPLDAADPAPAEAQLLGNVKVELDRVVRAGAMVSGTVMFSDGVRAVWSLDQAGRLALDAGKKGYRPSQEDVQAFQEAVSKELQKQGF